MEDEGKQRIGKCSGWPCIARRSNIFYIAVNTRPSSKRAVHPVAPGVPSTHMDRGWAPGPMCTWGEGGAPIALGPVAGRALYCTQSAIANSDCRHGARNSGDEPAVYNSISSRRFL